MRPNRHCRITAAGFVALMTFMTHSPANPPIAEPVPYWHNEHGQERPDPWHWLRERDNPKVTAYLTAENAYTDAYMQRMGDLPERLYKELVGRIEETDHSAPYYEGPFEYQARIEKGQNYRAYYRRAREQADAPWQCFFDANVAARDQNYFELGLFEISPDGNWLAYAIDTDGDEIYHLHFRDLRTGNDLPIVIANVSGEGEWDAASNAFFFIREDDSKRPWQIWRYPIGKPESEARIVYREDDPLFFLGIEKSQDGQFLFAVSTSKETSEVAVAGSDFSEPFRVLIPRQTGTRYSVEHHSGNWWIHTNDNAPDFKLITVPMDEFPLSAESLAQAGVLWPAQTGVRLNDVLPLREFAVFFERSNGLDRIRVRHLPSGNAHLIPTADSVYAIEGGHNAEFDTDTFDYSYSSPIRPWVTYRYNLHTTQQTAIDISKVPSGHDPEDYTVQRLLAQSADGTMVPFTLFHRKDLPRDGSRPAYLFAYGAYGDTEEPDFRRTLLTWLQRGWYVAIAHVRGGGLLGESWYQQGKLQFKQNTFSDFIAVAETLIAGQYTAADKLTIEGGSAGGLLIGAVLNQRPELFRAAIAAVPFVDVLSTMLDESLPLTTFEYEEWGNPNDPQFYHIIRSYSPYDNVRSQPYPAILATAGLNDPRVPYWEAAKWVANLRQNQTADQPILLKTHMEAGHSGSSGRYDYLRETAFEQAFLLSFFPPFGVED